MAAANKHVQMAALCYNLKKYLSFSRKKAMRMAAALSGQAGTAGFQKNTFLGQHKCLIQQL